MPACQDRSRETTFEKNNTTSKQVEDFLRSKKYVKSVFSNIGGSSDLVSLGNNANLSELNVKLFSTDEDDTETDFAAKECRNQLQNQFPSADLSRFSPFGANGKRFLRVRAANYRCAAA